METVAVSLSNLPEEARSSALARFEIIRPFLDDGVPLAIWMKPQAGWHVCGIPQVLYTYRGSDFTSRHIGQVRPI